MFNPIWVKPNLADEEHEFDKFTEYLHIPHEELVYAFNNGKLTILYKNMWERLNTTDSWETDTIEKVEATLAVYAKSGHIRITDNILIGIKENATMPAATVLRFKDKLYVVGGNTRLMCCRAHNIHTAIWLMEVQ